MMAGMDYFHCDWCSAKAFYDARLNYSESEQMRNRTDIPKLDFCDDIRALCEGCAQKYRVVVLPKVTHEFVDLFTDTAALLGKLEQELPTDHPLRWETVALRLVFMSGLGDG